MKNNRRSPGPCLFAVLSLSLALPAAAQSLSSVTLSPTSVTGGATSTGTVTLSANAPSGGNVVALSSANTGVATVPASVTVASGTKTKTFTVSTVPQASNTTVVISGVLSGITKTRTLTVNAPAMSAASVSPTSVKGGTGATLTVTLTGNAPTGGTAVTLASSNTQAASLPATATVLAGAKVATAPVTTLGVDANATVTLTATAGGVAKTASLTVSKPALSTLAISPVTIPGGGTATGTLTLTGPAGPSGATVTLSSNKTNVATVPGSKLIAAGQVTAAFTVTGTTLPAGGTATITATWSGVSKTATATLQPSASLQAVDLAASSIRGGQTVAGTVTLSDSAASGGVVVSLTSSDTAAATVPANVTVSQGQTTAGFTLTTAGVGSPESVTITGNSSGVSKTATLTVEPAVLTGLTISPETIPGGTTTTGTLTLDGPAGPSGATVSLESSDSNVATVPSTMVIDPGASIGTFQIEGVAVAEDGLATISATLDTETYGADVFVNRAIGTLTGTVKDASTGFTLPSAWVFLASDPSRETWTDGNGQYQLTDIPEGTHVVEASYEGFSNVTSDAVIVANGETVVVPPLSLLPSPGTISGTILDEGNGNQPLDGALVTDAIGLHTATTDASGHYELTGLEPGFTYLVIYKEGFHPGATEELSVDAGWPAEANVGVSPVREEDRPGEIEGVVRDTAGNPIGGAGVSIIGVPGLGTTSEPDGSYTLTVPAANGYLLEAQKPGYRRTPSRFLRASAGSRPYHVAHDFVLPPADATGTIVLRAFDPVSRSPFRGDLWFRTPSGLWHAPVAESGIRTVTGVPAGLVWGCTGPALLPAGGSLTMSCPGEPVVPEGSPRWAAAGIVMNRYSYEPIAGATATFVNGDSVAVVTTDVNGLFSTHSGPEGDYSVTVEAPGFLPTEPWAFTATDHSENGNFYGAWLWPDMPGGNVTLTAPGEGALLTASSILVEIDFTPARPGDQLLWAWAWPSAGNVTSVTPAYSADGLGAVITIEGDFPNGPLTLGLEAVSRTGAGFTVERNVTIGVPSRPTGLTVTPASVGGDSVAMGTVTIDPPAPAGGASVSLSSSSTVVSVPASLLFAEGESTMFFEAVASQVEADTVVTISASAAGTTKTATLTVNPRFTPPLAIDLADGGLSGWEGFADPPYGASVSVDTTRVKVGSSSLRFMTDSGFDCGVRYVVPGGAHWDLSGARFLTFWSFGDGTEAYQGEQPVVVLRGPTGSIRLQPPALQTVNGDWRFHRVPLGDTSDWIRTTEGVVSPGDITSFEIHQDTWGMGLTVFYDGVAFISDLPEDLAEGTAALWGTFASDNLATSVVDDGSDVRSGASALLFDTASGFDTGLVFPKPGPGQTHWDLSDVRNVMVWIRPENAQAFQGNQPILVLRSPLGSVRYEPGDVLVNTPGWRFYEIPLEGAFPWTRTQTGTPDASDVTAIELHGDTWGSGFRLHVDGVSVGRPLPLLTLPSTSTPAGGTVTASVFLSDAAPTGGRTVLISSSDSGLASVPASVVVPEGARSATFPVATGSVTTGTPVTITVTDRGFSAWTSLRVDPVVDVTSLTVGTPSTIGGLSVGGTVTIAVPAWAGGTAVTLTSSNTGVASVPAVVTVPVSGTTASFSVTTGAVASDTPVTISANAGAATATASLTIVPAPAPEVASLVVTPSTVLSGSAAQLTVSLAAPAPVGGAIVALAASPAGLVSLPASVTVAAGATTAESTVNVPVSTGPVEITLTATVGSTIRTAALAVALPAALVSVSASPTAVTASGSTSVLIRLVSAAPSGGKTVSLTSSVPEALVVPATATVVEGATSATVIATAPASAPDATVTITASDASTQKTATVAVLPTARISALSFAASGGFPGESVTGTLTLTAAAPVGGYPVDLISSQPGVTSVPASVVVPTGQLSTTFLAQVAASGPGGWTTVSASQHGVTKQASLTNVALSDLRVSSSVAVPRAPVHLQVVLAAPVPTGRVVDLSLASSNPAVASVPATAQVPANVSYLLVPVTRTEVASDTQVEFTVTALGETRTVTVLLEPLKVISVVPISGHTSVGACSRETMRITTNATAPTGGAAIQIQMVNGRPIAGSPVPGSSPPTYNLSLAEGKATLDVITRANWTLEPLQLGLTALLGPSQVTHTMAIQPGTVSVSATPSTAPRGSTVRFRLGLSGDYSCIGIWSLDAPASSDQPAVFNVPAIVPFTWSNDTWAWYVDLPVPATALSGVARLSFAVLGATATVDVTVPESSLASFSLNPTEAPAGAQVTGLVSVDAPAPAGGIQVLLQSSDPSKASVPASVEIPAGVSSVSFTLTPQETAAAADAVVTATVDGESLTASFRALPANAATIVGRIVDSTDYDVEGPVLGATATHLPGPGQYLTGIDGTFRLHSEPGSATVQFAAPGFLPFTTEPLPLAASQTLDIGTHRARRPGGGPRGTSGTVVDPQGNPIYGAEGVLEGYDLSVRTDGAGRFHLNVPESRLRYRMTFSKAGYQTWTEDFVPGLSADSCMGTGLDCFVLDPYPRNTLYHAAFEKTSGLSESRVQLQVVMYGVRAYGAKVSLTQATVRSPGMDTIEQRTLPPMQSGDFLAWPVDLPKVTEPTNVEYVLFYGGQRTSASIEVVPQTLEIRCSGPLNPTTTSWCSVNLRTGRAPADGAVVSLTSSDPDLFSVPASVTVPPGEWTVDFPLTVTGLVFTDGHHPRRGTLRASWAGGWGEASLVAFRPDVTSVALSPAAVVGGNQATGTVRLWGPAYPTGQTIVTLESTLSNITVPPTVTIAPGASTATFPIATTPVTQPTTGTIRARLTTLSDHQMSNPEQRTADLLLTLSGLGLACTPTEIAGGYSVSCQVSLPGSPAPAGGTIISLSSSSGVVAVPASVTVPEGQLAKTFSVTTTPTVSTTTGVVRATLGAEVAEVTLTVRQPTLTYLDSLYGNSGPGVTVEGGSPIHASVRLDGYAPAGGILVQLSSASTMVTLPPSVLIPEGADRKDLDVPTSSVAAPTEVVLSASSGPATVTRTFTLNPQTWRLSALAPGRVVAGVEDVIVYGRDFVASDTVRLSGPVYSLMAPDAPLCDEPAGACPGVDASDATEVSLGGMSFTVPASLSSGYYSVRAKSAAGTLSSEARWLLLDDPSPIVPALAPEQHGLARPITSGQTVTGTFVENGDTSGATNDFNLYYLVAAAGARVSVRVERADASLPWEHPDSLDPQVSLIAPDGFVYENEGHQDVVRATDLNAEVTDLTLTQTGMWLIAASTSRGHGDYRITYTMTAPGSVPSTQRIVPFTGRGTTAPVGTDVRLTLAAMDPRGYLLSGAGVRYTASYPDPGAGTVVWPEGRNTFTAVDGLAQVRLRSTTQGIVDIGTNLFDIITASSPDPVAEALAETTLATLPRYQPLEHHPYVIREVDPDGNVTLDLGPVKTFEPSRPSRLRTEWRSGPEGVKSLGASPAAAPDHEPAPAPRPLPATEALVTPACTVSTPFRHVGVQAPELKTPYTVTLKDVSDGKSPEGVPIGEKGIEGYRIEKNVKLMLDVKDRDGNPPPHPVLVRLAVGGPRSGRLLVGPAGAQQWCKEAYVVWHEADSQGNPGTDPVAFEYTLGTLSLLPGVEPDPDHPGQVKPVWGVAEVLEATTEAVTPEATLLDQTVFAVRPQPGKPQRLVDWDGPPEDDRWEWWNSFYTYFDPALGARAVHVTNYNAYTLVDKYGNTVWGCRDTRTVHGGARLSVNLPYQETTGPDFRAYALEMKWWADGSDQMPQGATSVDLWVGYPADTEWGAGEVYKRTLIDLQGGTQTHLKSYGGYEARFGMDDGAFPMSVSPTAHDGGIPKVGPGPAWASPRNLDANRRMALVLLTGKEAPSTQEVFRAPHHPWEWSGGAWVPKPVVPAPDPKIDVSSKPRLKMKLIDVNGNIQASAGFMVHLCPRFDHEGSPAAPEWVCPIGPVESTNGVIEELTMNPGVVGNGDPPSPDATGYLGLELTQAPAAPGTYYVYVESLDKDVKIRDQSLLHLDDTPDGQFQGGFALCTVTAAEFLDESFQRIEPLSVVGPTNAYVRFTDPGEAGGSILVDVNSYDGESELDTAPDVSLTRVGRSGTFLSEPIELNPPWTADDPALRTTLAARPKKIRVNPWKAEKVEAIRRHPTTSIARSKTVGPGGVFRFPVGLRLPLTLYRSFTFYSRQARYDLCSPQGGRPCGTDIIDPTSVTWRVEPIGVDVEGDTQIARLEVERNTSPPQEFVRGIRISTGKAWVPGGVIAVSASTGLQEVASAPVQVARPDALGTYADITRDYEGTPVDLKKLIIDTADQNGIPPHYLAAQMYAESSFKPYAYRYEPTSQDFKLLVGDWHQTVDGGVRRLYSATAAFSKLGIRRGTVAEFLPSQTAPPDSLTPGTASIPGQEPPAIETFTFVADGSSTSYQVAGLNGDKMQLGVDVRRPGAVLREFAQDLLADCAGDALTLSEFCVDGDAGTLRFGLPPVGEQVVSFRRVKVLRDVPPPGDFGSLIGGAAEQQAAIDKIRLRNPPANVRPPASLSTTIRQWAIQRGTNPLLNNKLERWGELFSDSDLFTLIKRDPSFEVQGQWFGAASYGLLQVIPETVQSLYRNRAALSAGDAEFLRNTYYDPMTQNPLGRLFDPANCVPMGAEILVRARVKTEDQDPDPACTHKRNECTWRNIWSSRLCRFNTGGEGPCMYGNRIVFGADAEPPLVDSFVPRLNP